ncbi:MULTISPECIES: hypothetical protein [Actinokineospora]|uniref:Uncharacterized protein n=1 Tax=Actinokineospora fastidiosa TaxID=1816 RepID=A0A918G4U6_9PSEU|nr:MULTISPECIES: hypothetical protein [Actinokineospora]UVS76344.1 hypothetical protein Actkin_00027 [Actinokineospora sp. UTMC 2448]GGS18894.1 hypothetical protein GCM10010171_09330 [Actinokineospora fastidiosa]
MTRAGETVGKAVGTGWRAVRQGAAQARAAGAEAAQAAEHRLAARGLAPQQVAEALAESALVAREELQESGKRARKRLAKTAARTRKDLAKAAKQARKNAGNSRAGRGAAGAVKPLRAQAKQLKKDLKPQVEAYRAELREQVKAARAAAKAAAKENRGPRRWPWLIAAVAMAAGAVVALRGKKRTEEEVVTPVVPTPMPEQTSAERNGQAKPEVRITAEKQN